LWRALEEDFPTKPHVQCDQKYWGDSTSNPIADPNPRLERLIAATRRGARARVLVDSLLDDAGGIRSNKATLDYLDTIAEPESKPG
jgi:hypothetical protein